MAYQVKEIYLTLQGEGAKTGSAAVFVRFAGCNLWSGREADRAEAACYFCDTDFVGVDGPGGGSFKEADSLAKTINQHWPANGGGEKLVVFTGGEPLLQLDKVILTAVKEKGFTIAVETNGTISSPQGIDWLTVSPKPGSNLIQRSGNELKLVYPHEITPETVVDLEFEHFYLMPMATQDLEQSRKNMEAAADYCLKDPRWKFCLQMHKVLGIA